MNVMNVRFHCLSISLSLAFFLSLSLPFLSLQIDLNVRRYHSTPIYFPCTPWFSLPILVKWMIFKALAFDEFESHVHTHTIEFHRYCKIASLLFCFHSQRVHSKKSQHLYKYKSIQLIHQATLHLERKKFVVCSFDSLTFMIHQIALFLSYSVQYVSLLIETHFKNSYADLMRKYTKCFCKYLTVFYGKLPFRYTKHVFFFLLQKKTEVTFIR